MIATGKLHKCTCVAISLMLKREMGDNFMLIVLWVFVTAVCIAMEYSSIRTVAQSTTTDETDNQSEFFYTQNLVILFAVAGFVLLAIFAFIFVYAKAGRGTANFIARMRQEVLAEALPRRPSVDLGVAPSIELIWDSRDPRYQPARRAAKRSRAAIPFVQENADTRPKSILSENIYHEIGEHADDGELPQSDSQSNPQPSMDEDGYLAPRDLIRQGAAKQM
ncbi:hypothetical protein BaRGS_00031918 [Batillaria attramentaria]|uniref:Uncharacterized protein n=1 Tax=Batillaria attramentaria TaxID=370345 RepID=A0ABD0JQ21_9CAEN